MSSSKTPPGDSVSTNSLYEVTSHDRAGERWFRSRDLDIAFAESSEIRIDFRWGSNSIQINFKDSKLRIFEMDTGENLGGITRSSIVKSEWTRVPLRLIERLSEAESDLPADLSLKLKQVIAMFHGETF